MIPQNFKQQFLDATIHLVNAILKIIFYPFTFWTKAMAYLAQLKKPIYDQTVGLNLDLLFNGISFLSYPLGIIYLIYLLFDGNLEFAHIINIYVLPVIVWIASIAFKFAIKLLVVVIKMMWTAFKTFVLKIYNFIVNPQWHFAIKHIHKQEE